MSRLYAVGNGRSARRVLDQLGIGKLEPPHPQRSSARLFSHCRVGQGIGSGQERPRNGGEPMKRNLQAGVRRNAALRLEVFTDADLDDIHRATLEVLERTGVFVESDDALDVMADGGCRVDRETKIVKIPPHIVEDAIRSSPSSVRLCGRVPENDVVLEGGRVGFTNFSAGIMVIDPRTDEYRKSSTQDVADLARMTDYLSEIDTYE